MEEKNEVKTVFAVFKKINDYKHPKRRIDAMVESDNYVIRTILQGAFDAKINFGFPAGDPPYVQTEKPVELDKDIIKALGLCINKSLQQWKREDAFIKILNVLHADDVKVLIAMKDKNLSSLFPSIDKALVKKAFPNLI